MHERGRFLFVVRALARSAACHVRDHALDLEVFRAGKAAEDDKGKRAQEQQTFQHFSDSPT